MILEQNKFHKNFQLNGNSFSSIDELLEFSKTISSSVHYFLSDWFLSANYILVQTSGSTGKPKQISLKKKYMVNSALATGEFFDLPEKTSALLCLSTDYIAGKMMLVRALTLGWNLDIIESVSNPLEYTNKNYGFSAMVPLQLENSLTGLHRIKKLIVGGGVVSETLQSKIKDVDIEVFATYGMTETITHIAVKKLNHLSESVTSRGVEKSFYQVLPNLKIYQDQRNCLVIEAPKVSSELIFTNDVVQLISDTQFEWLGRFDNVINSGGIKLQPEKIEKTLSTIIKERFFVAGIPDKSLGEKLVLVIESESFKDEKLQSLIKEEVRESSLLSKYEIPKEIYFVESFVETETGKIQRNKTLKNAFN